MQSKLPHKWFIKTAFTPSIGVYINVVKHANSDNKQKNFYVILNIDIDGKTFREFFFFYSN